jgi:transcriptional regulator with XRE-family HTH domain
MKHKQIIDKDLPDFLKETRTKLGLTLREMAEILKTTDRNYRRWESGENEPSGQAIAKIYYLREENPEIFNPKQPIINVTTLAQQQSSLLEQLASLVLLFKQQEDFLEKQRKERQEYEQKSINQTQHSQPSNKVQSQSNQQEIDKLFQLFRKLENRLAFLEEKCGYPYQPSQYSNYNHYSSDPNPQYKKKRR